MQIHFQEVIIMNKNTFTTVKLAKGEMNIYDFGGIKLHAYKTNDFIDDEVFVVEKNGKAVIIESGESFDSSVHKITNVVESGKVTIGGMDFIIKQTADAFDVEIPEISVVYTHMLGHDCHSIVAGAGHADAMIAELRSYIAKGYNLILPSHYTPEDLKDAQTKIDYLENLKKIAAGCKNADEFKAEVGRQYPAYSGQNYLDMTAGFFFA